MITSADVRCARCSAWANASISKPSRLTAVYRPTARGRRLHPARRPAGLVGDAARVRAGSPALRFLDEHAAPESGAVGRLGPNNASSKPLATTTHALASMPSRPTARSTLPGVCTTMRVHCRAQRRMRRAHAAAWVHAPAPFADLLERHQLGPVEVADDRNPGRDAGGRFVERSEVVEQQHVERVGSASLNAISQAATWARYSASSSSANSGPGCRDDPHRKDASASRRS